MFKMALHGGLLLMNFLFSELGGWEKRLRLSAGPALCPPVSCVFHHRKMLSRRRAWEKGSRSPSRRPQNSNYGSFGSLSSGASPTDGRLCKIFTLACRISGALECGGLKMSERFAVHSARQLPLTWALISPTTAPLKQPESRIARRLIKGLFYFNLFSSSWNAELIKIQLMPAWNNLWNIFVCWLGEGKVLVSFHLPHKRLDLMRAKWRRRRMNNYAERGEYFHHLE